MKIRNLDTTDTPVSRAHGELRIPPVELAISQPGTHPALRTAGLLAALVLAGMTVYLGTRLFAAHPAGEALTLISETLQSSPFWTAVAVGLLAQAVDGALGMAYGVTATAFLLGTGVSPAVATASVHMSEVFTTGLSGLSHLKFGNVDRRLFLRLLAPGIAGTILGAIVVTQVDGSIMKPVVSVYLAGIGVYILWKAFRHLRMRAREPRHVAKLALLGGFVDSAGGGGWGPVVTSSLIGSGQDPRTTIGSVNFAEFFLTLASAATFALLVGSNTWPTIAGLIVGGMLAAPFAALLCSRIPARNLMILVGTLISALSAYSLGTSLLG